MMAAIMVQVTNLSTPGSEANPMHGFSETDDPQFDGKILYQKAKKGVFPPSDFDPICVTRSAKVGSVSGARAA